MTENALPPGLVLWPGEDVQRIAVLISDIHCTDCTVGNQTADEADWKGFFSELEMRLDAAISGNSEILLVLNGDVVDLLRSGRWAEANVYPWQRAEPGFRTTVLEIMHEIVRRHAHDPAKHGDSSGFFYYLRQTVQRLRARSRRVTLIPIVGNHDKELQVVPEAREIFYRLCLGFSADDLDGDYRGWLAQQMASDPADPWPVLPFYFADPLLRLFATHGQWRDDTNSRATRRWKFRYGWQPQLWQQERFGAFSAPCFGDTIASGLLSHFIWNTTQAIEREVIPHAVRRDADGTAHILRVLREMDLYRPAARAVVRLLEEARKLDRRDADARLLYQTVIDQFHHSLQSWLGHRETFCAAPLRYKLLLSVISLLSRLRWTWLDTVLMRLMAWASDVQGTTPYSRLPAFLAAYRALGFRLHAEGHTHQVLEMDLRFSTPQERRNYTYVNLGAWRNRIVQKFEQRGYRRRSIGRALIVQGDADSYGFTLRDHTSWGDRLDKW